MVGGRSGAGKSTLVRALLARTHGKEPKSTLFDSTIAAEHEIEVGVYEQKIDLKLLGDYLFDSAIASGMLVGQLSG